MVDRIDGHLRETLDDRRLSRREKKALRALVGPEAHERSAWHQRAFALAREAMTAHPEDQAAILEWLDDVTRLLVQPPDAAASVSEVLFSPGIACRRRLGELLREARDGVDICVFTITDDRLAGPIVAAHRRGVRVRIIGDDDKAHDAGSDMHRLRDAGVPVRFDRSPHHMHHKFALFDGQRVATGSYNWTRSAADHNRENMVVTDEPTVVRAYHAAFEDLWRAYG